MNGQAAVQITYHLRPSAEPGPSGKLRTVKIAGPDIGQPWDEYTQGDDSYVTTVTMFEVDGEVVMAEAAGKGSEAEHAAAVATLNQQLAAMTW